MKHKYRKIFGVGFILPLMAVLLLTGSGVYNLMVMRQTQQELEESKKVMLYDNRKSEGAVQLLDINVLVDASGTGWPRVQDGLLDNIGSAFENFPGQHHRIIFNSYCKNDSDERSSQVFVDTCDKQAIRQTIDTFKEFYEENGTDAPYVKMIENGLKSSDKKARKQGRKNILILIVGGPDSDIYTTRNAHLVEGWLKEYDASLYCIGLEEYSVHSASHIDEPHYKRFELFADTDKIYKYVKLEQIKGIVDQIVRAEAFGSLLTSPEIVIPRENEDFRLADLSIDMYAKGEVTGVIQKVTQNGSDTSNESLREIEIKNGGTTYQFTKDELDDLADPFTVKITLDSDSDNVYYRYTYNMYRKINKALDGKIRMAHILYIASFAAAALMLIALLIIKIKAIKLRNENYAFFHQNKV